MNGDARQPNLFLSRPRLESVIEQLDEEGVTVVITDDAGNQITYLSHGRIEASSFEVPRFRHLEQLTLDRQAVDICAVRAQCLRDAVG